jgi:hypothetical protein
MVYYAYGTALLTQEEAHQQNVRERAQELLRSSRQGKQLAPLSLGTGELSTEMVTSDAGAVVDWQPIGISKPLTVEIREVYTGKHPGGGLFGGASDMLLASAVKGIAINEAKPLALNFLTQRIQKKSRLARPRASEQGTPVVYHSPAITDRSLTMDLSIVFDQFPKEIFDSVSSAFKGAAGLPVFLSYSSYLLAAGEIIRIAGALGEKFLDGKAAFHATENIDLALPGAARSVAGFMLVTPENVDVLDPAFRKSYQVRNGTLTDDKGQPYSGDIPYIILAVDGSDREDLSNFAPMAASAAVLSRFYGIKDGQRISLEPMNDALRLYNDWTYRSQIDQIDKQLAKLQDGAEKDQLNLRRTALAKNIVNDLLKPG